MELKPGIAMMEPVHKRGEEDEDDLVQPWR
ncbi:hypothetical protein SAMN05660463_03250 [Pseudomonas sp. URIL14HWK12:I9]|nr:hypothetical protein F474_03760 [Pseudomonas sp. URIL14HWK12:I12]PVZ22430.1 hypothetical protein F470_03760 [Pseudomonas sp. URIL14HWK12:I10]PVZ31446.1 hypothetical protein F472_03611 [Pseudomonas sp. URIL14HWK12:I11]SNZ16310.1 hypothetical protein SAMN05660463_03250 [Pseudomonas sp. URIL14HWK12:I9]